MKALMISILAATLSPLAAEARQQKGGDDREHRGPPPPEAVMKHDDANQDGVITSDEFRGPDHVFGHIDANQNGELTLEELKAHKPPKRKCPKGERK